MHELPQSFKCHKPKASDGAAARTARIAYAPTLPPFGLQSGGSQISHKAVYIILPILVFPLTQVFGADLPWISRLFFSKQGQRV